MLTLDQLRTLTAIANSGSLAGAARELHLSQPTISHHLAALEANLGGSVVKRGPTGSQLTELGRMVLPQSRAVADQIANIERDVRAFVQHGTATIDIGCFPTVASSLLPGPLARLRQHGPPFRMFVGEPTDIAANCARRAYDVAVLLSEPDTGVPAPEWMAARVLMDDPLLVIMPLDHALAAKRRLELADVINEAWISTTSDTDPEHTLLLRAFAERGREPTFTIRADDSQVSQALVAAGLGLALLPQLAAAQARPDIALLPIDNPRFVRRIHIAWRPNQSGITAFIDDVSQAAATLLSNPSALGSASVA